MKTHRLHVIFNSRILQHSVGITNRHMMSRLSLVVLADAVLLITWHALSPYQSSSLFAEYNCTRDHDQVNLAFTIILVVVQTLFGRLYDCSQPSRAQNHAGLPMRVRLSPLLRKSLRLLEPLQQLCFIYWWIRQSTQKVVTACCLWLCTTAIVLIMMGPRVVEFIKMKGLSTVRPNVTTMGDLSAASRYHSSPATPSGTADESEAKANSPLTHAFEAWSQAETDLQSYKEARSDKDGRDAG